MLVFPIESTRTDLPQHCRWEPLGEKTYCLRFFRGGKPLADPVVVTAPEQDQYALLDSAVSGGTFRGFLSDAMSQYKGRICLYLRAQARRFSLPCPDGLGTPLPSDVDLAGFQFSDPLCAFWRIGSPGDPCLEIADGIRSLREKYRLAEELDIPYLIASRETLEIVKAPYGQGALGRMDTERDQ